MNVFAQIIGFVVTQILYGFFFNNLLLFKCELAFVGL